MMLSMHYAEYRRGVKCLPLNKLSPPATISPVSSVVIVTDTSSSWSVSEYHVDHRSCNECLNPSTRIHLLLLLFIFRSGGAVVCALLDAEGVWVRSPAGLFILFFTCLVDTVAERLRRPR